MKSLHVSYYNNAYNNSSGVLHNIFEYFSY